MVLISSKPLWTHCEFNKMLSYFNRNINNNKLTFNLRVSTALQLIYKVTYSAVYKSMTQRRKTTAEWQIYDKFDSYLSTLTAEVYTQ